MELEQKRRAQPASRNTEKQNRPLAHGETNINQTQQQKTRPTNDPKQEDRQPSKARVIPRKQTKNRYIIKHPKRQNRPKRI